ncbi:MAG: phage tail protein I [Rhodobacter sp.]|nr:phage tail protein I [Rhodobacter sp.]
MSEVQTLLPVNATPTERSIEAATARIGAVPVPVGTLWQVETCPEPLLPWLAWALSADVWNGAWPEDIKRAALAATVEVHRKKGTRAAVQAALDALGMSMDLIEWFESSGAPYTFRIDVFADDIFNAGFNVDNRLVELVARRLDTVKPVRAHYDLRVGESFRGHAHARSGTSERFADTDPRAPEPRAAGRSRAGQTGRFDLTPAPRPGRTDARITARPASRARTLHAFHHDVLTRKAA